MRESRYVEEPQKQPPRRSRAKKALLDETGISSLELDWIDDPVLNGDIPVYIMRKTGLFFPATEEEQARFSSCFIIVFYMNYPPPGRHVS